ncbi:MAG TPA: ferrous iron transport protein A [Dehalococcoidia bacterium]
MPSLDKLRPGQRGRIAALTGDDALVQRLMEMGLFEGEEVEVP